MNRLMSIGINVLSYDEPQDGKQAFGTVDFHWRDETGERRCHTTYNVSQEDMRALLIVEFALLSNQIIYLTPEMVQHFRIE